jgi:DivIVA domain-containing protein
MRKKNKEAAADTSIAEAAAEASTRSAAKQGPTARTAGAVSSPAEPSSKKKASSAGGRLTPLDIQQVEFRRGFKGYDEREVDEFLDRLTEDFAAALDESQRLRARLESGLASVGTSAPADAGAEAERIVERARAEAAGIIRDAEAEAARKGAPDGLSPTGASPGRTAADRRAVSEFLNSEREFLKHLASLVQGHVDDVKSMAAKQPRSKPRSGAPAAPSDKATGAGGDRQTGAGISAAAPAKGSPVPGPRAGNVVEPVSSVEIVVDENAAPDGGAGARPAGERAVPVQARGPNPPAAGGSDDQDDPSLRELFWGED